MGSGYLPFTLNHLSTTDFPVYKSGTSEDGMRSLRPTAMLNYSTVYLHNVLKCIVSCKGSYLVIFNCIVYRSVSLKARNICVSHVAGWVPGI